MQATKFKPAVQESTRLRHVFRAGQDPKDKPAGQKPKPVQDTQSKARSSSSRACSSIHCHRQKLDPKCKPVSSRTSSRERSKAMRPYIVQEQMPVQEQKQMQVQVQKKNPCLLQTSHLLYFIYLFIYLYIIAKNFS